MGEEDIVRLGSCGNQSDCSFIDNITDEAYIGVVSDKQSQGTIHKHGFTPGMKLAQPVLGVYRTDPLPSKVPTLLCINVRSAFPKLQSICDEILEREATISFLTEIWQDINNPMHSNQLERALQLQGIEIITNPRRGRRGGGVAIALNIRHEYQMTKLQVNCTSGKGSLEAVWALIRPKTPGDAYKAYICCSFYAHPNSKINPVLLEHLQYNTARLSIIYPKCCKRTCWRQK